MGYIDKTGSLVITPQFIQAFPFTNGVARFWTGAFVGLNKWGLIDRSGKETLPPQFDNIVNDFHEGLAPFRVGGKWGFIDITGKIIIPARFDGARDFSEGFGRVAVRSKFNLFLWASLTEVARSSSNRNSKIPAIFRKASHGFDDSMAKLVTLTLPENKL